MSAHQNRRADLDAATAGEGLVDVLRRRERNLELGLRVAAPATVTGVNAAAHTVDVIMGFRPVRISDLGIEVQGAPIVIPRVPIEWSATMAGQAYDTSPVLPGDTGILTFYDRCLEQWMALGQTGAVDPIDGRTHDLADATWRPDLRPRAATLPAIDPTARVIEGPVIKVGAAATPVTDSAALARLVHTYMVNLITAGVPVAMDGGASLKTTMLAYLAANPFTSMGSTKVNVAP